MALNVDRIRTPNADHYVVRDEANGKGRQACDQESSNQCRLTADAIARVAKDDRANRTSDCRNVINWCREVIY
jgi:hypothetical protein